MKHREELAGQLVEAFAHLRAEADALEAGEREAFVSGRLAPIAYLFDEAGARGVLERARTEHGDDFAAWVEKAIDGFKATVPPASVERRRPR